MEFSYNKVYFFQNKADRIIIYKLRSVGVSSLYFKEREWQKSWLVLTVISLSLCYDSVESIRVLFCLKLRVMLDF